MYIHAHTCTCTHMFLMYTRNAYMYMYIRNYVCIHHVSTCTYTPIHCCIASVSYMYVCIIQMYIYFYTNVYIYFYLLRGCFKDSLVVVHERRGSANAHSRRNANLLWKHHHWRGCVINQVLKIGYVYCKFFIIYVHVHMYCRWIFCGKEQFVMVQISGGYFAWYMLRNCLTRQQTSVCELSMKLSRLKQEVCVYNYCLIIF